MNVVVKVSPSLACQVDDHLTFRWKAICPLCKWVNRDDRRTLVERALRDHLGSHEKGML